MKKRNKTITTYCLKNDRRTVFLLDHNGVFDKFRKNMLPVISADKADEFIKEANENRMSESFLKDCEKSSSLFTKNV